MSVINTLNDLSWDMLDVFHLGEFFDSHGIPPILFPILLISIVLLVVFFLLMPAGAPAGECGDGICAELKGEDAQTCPEDCAITPPPIEPDGKTIRVYLSGGVTCRTVNVVLKDGDGAVIESKMNQENRAFIFQDVTTDRVSVEVSSDQSTKPTVRAGPINTKSEDVLRATMANDYCTEVTNYGSLRVVVKDSQTDQPIGANVALFDSGETTKGNKFINGEGTFTNLEADEWYYLTATAPGYQDYYGRTDQVFVEKNQQATATITMSPATSTTDATGKLEVCVTGDSEPIEHSGEIGVYSVDGDLIKVGRLSECPLFRGQASGEGCYIFELPADTQVFAGINRAPSGCSVGDREGPIIIVENEKELVTIELDCNLVGSIRAIVYGNDSEVLTDQCTVELYHENDTKIRTMDMSDDGEHTQSITLKADLEVYVYAKNVPDGYLETKSRDVDIDEGENKTVSITLKTPPPPLPNLTIVKARIDRQIVHEGGNITITVKTVRFKGTTPALTPDDGVSVACESSWGQTVSAVYKGFWECNLTTPEDSVGQKTVVVRATKENANPDAKSITLYVVNETERSLFMEEIDMGPFPKVELTFNITYENETGSGELLPVPAVQESNMMVYFESEDESFRGLVANLTDWLYGGNGLFTIAFDVPFTGHYDYKLRVRAVVGDKLHIGYISGDFIAPGITNAISCSIDPGLVGPDEQFKVSATFPLLNSAPLPRQQVKVTVIGRRESWSNRLIWNEETKKYEGDVFALSSECEYTINCSAMDAPSTSKTTALYVADPEAVGVNPIECVNRDRNLLNTPSQCNSLIDARNCYAYLKANPTLKSLYVDRIVTCAGNGLESCASPEPHSAECHQAVKLKVRVDNGSHQNTSDFLYFKVDGSSQGQVSALNYAKPSLGGGDKTYSMVDIHLSGGESEPILDKEGPDDSHGTSGVTVQIDEDNGALTATAYCPLNCGGIGNLDGEADITEVDEIRMTIITDTIEILGSRPYTKWPPYCLDINDDTFINRQGDLDCIIGLRSGQFSSFDDCPDCVQDSQLEVCHDGDDNDCDGQTDTETFDSALGDFYGFQGTNLEDLCNCTPKTPCEMLYKISGLQGSISTEQQVRRCSSLDDGGTFVWRAYDDWRCTSDKDGDTLSCGDSSYICNQEIWNLLGPEVGTYPPNPLPLQ